MVRRTTGFNFTAAGVSTCLWRGVMVRDVLLACGLQNQPEDERWCVPLPPSSLLRAYTLITLLTDRARCGGAGSSTSRVRTRPRRARTRRRSRSCMR